MKNPKMLPWLARKAGVPLTRAEQLWAEAIRHATVRTGWVGTSEYWHVATERLLALLAEERAAQRRKPFSRVVYFQTRLWLLPLVLWQRVGLTASWLCVPGARG